MFDNRNTFFSGKPDVAFFINSNITDVIIWQPAPALTIFPVFSIITNSAFSRSKPDNTFFTCCDSCKIIIWKSIMTSVECPFFIETSDSLWCGKPDSALFIQSHSPSIDQCPASHAVLRKNWNPAILRILLFKQR